MATELKIFSLKWYLDHNPDVAAAVAQGLVDAFEHFEQYGKTEGRSMGPLFDVDLYLEQNPDVAEAVARGETTAYDHFMQYGAGEDRTPSALFDEAFYLLQNPDVAAAVQAGTMTAVQHFLSYGQSEPRPFNPSIDLGAYLQANPDIAAAVQNGFVSAMEHLMVYGATEGRDLGNGVNLGMFANDNSFQQALSSGDITGALQRVGEVAPFLPTFQPPVGWTPPPDTPIPLDFVPPAGTQLVIPPTVVVPPNVVLPPVFTPPAPPAPTPGGGGGATGPTFSVALDVDSGAYVFNGTASGNITMKVVGDQASFTRSGVEAAMKLTVSGAQTVQIALVQNDALIANGVELDGLDIRFIGSGNVDITGVEMGSAVIGGAEPYLASKNTNIAKIISPSIEGSANITINGNDADLIKLSWIYFDQKYYAEFPDSYYDLALTVAKADLALKYVSYLADGGLPFTDFVAKIAGTVDNVTRSQSMHDNLLGELVRAALDDRLSGLDRQTEHDFYINEGGKFVDRPYYDGVAGKEDIAKATIVWDVAHGIERELAGDGKVFVIHSGARVTEHDNVEDAVSEAQGGDTIYVGPGVYNNHDINIAKPNLHVILSSDAIIHGGFAIHTLGDGFHLSGEGEIQGGMASSLIAGSAGKAIYVQKNADVTIEGVTLSRTGELAGQLRGIEVEGGSSHVAVDGAAIKGWVTGIYVNPGNHLFITDSALSNNGVGIGTEGPNTLSVSDNKFSGSQWEDIGLTPGKVIGSADISNNKYSGDGITSINNGANTGIFELHGANVLLGTAGDDALVGAAGPQTILGLSGNDIIRGDSTPAAGQETNPASYGDDTIDGGLGTNILVLGTSRQNIKYGGQDTILAGGNQGTDIIFNFNFGPIERADPIGVGDPTKDLTFDIVKLQGFTTIEQFAAAVTIGFGNGNDAYTTPLSEFGITDVSEATTFTVGGETVYAGNTTEYELVITFNEGGGKLVFANAMSRFENARFLKALNSNWNSENKAEVDDELDALDYANGGDPSAGMVTLTETQALAMIGMMVEQGNFALDLSIA